MFNRMMLALSAALLAFGAAGSAQASLIGQTIDAQLSTTFTGLAVLPTSAMVTTGGPEFVFQLDPVPTRVINIDVQASSIEFSYSGGGNAGLTAGNISITFSNLSWGSTPGEIVGVTVTEFEDNTQVNPGGVALGPNTASSTANSVTVFLSGTWQGDDRVVVDLDVRHLPEPATIALLGFGLAGLGAAARRKRAA